MRTLRPSPTSSGSDWTTSAPPHASSWAAPPEFYLDENLAGRTAWRLIAELGYTVHTPASVFGRAALQRRLYDDQWLPVVGAKGWVVVGRDQQILSREHELRAYLDAKVHLFLLPGQSTRSQIVHLLQVNLREMCALATARKPNVYWLTTGGIVPYERRVSKRSGRRNRSGAG